MENLNVLLSSQVIIIHGTDLMKNELSYLPQINSTRQGLTVSFISRAAYYVTQQTLSMPKIAYHLSQNIFSMPKIMSTARFFIVFLLIAYNECHIWVQ